MSEVIRVAVVGLGWVALHRHIPAFRRNPAFRLVGVVDRHSGRAVQVAAKLGLSRFAEADDLSRVAWLDEVDAVSIAAPPFAHAALAQTALSRGKHVLVEKPFAMTVAEGEAMVAAAKAQERVLAVVHNFQFSRGASTLRRDLATGRLGPLRRVAAVQLGNPRRRLPRWFKTLPLGSFYDESPHFFYLLRWLVGGDLSLQHAYGAALREDGDDMPALLSLLYKNTAGLPVTIDCQFDSAVSEWHVMVTGERALGVLDVFRDIYLRLPNDQAHGLSYALRTSAWAFVQHAWQHVPNGIAYLRGRLDYGNDSVVARFARAIGGDAGALQGVSAEDALAVLRLQHEAVLAVRENWMP